MKTLKALFLIIAVLLVLPAISQVTEPDPLPFWNNTKTKADILDFVKYKAKSIPDSCRIAVFDMDGTIACEAPLWFEMYVAVHGMNQQWKANSNLLVEPECQYARLLEANPFDTLISAHMASKSVNYIDSIIWKAYAGCDNEVYIDSARSYLQKTKSKDPRFNMFLADMFYQPMLELIKYLQANKFEVYIVSGSLQGLLWSICPQVIGFDRVHLIGTRQQMDPVYYPTKATAFILKPAIWVPKNDGNGKALNIYSYIGKIPVFAFGNTTGDFGMFRITSTSTYPHACFLLNHDDAEHEYVYPPWHGAGMPAWQDTMKCNGWHIVNMSTNFKQVWMNK